MLNLQDARALLRNHRQEHLLAFVDELPPDRTADLLGQIGRIDFGRLDALIRSHVLAEPPALACDGLAPAPILPAHPADPAEYAEARARGEALIAAGKVAALVVAGGDGTRLGFDGPKGCLPATAVRGKSLFAVLAEQILATARRYATRLPWYVMTSPSNDAATRAFFADNNFFGLDPADVMFFTQGQMPVVGTDGRILLADKDRIALSPNGHGGVLAALRDAGGLDDMARRGVEVISYFQVDNPLVRCVDPLFVGLHATRGAEMSAKALPKRDPLERLGNFCLADRKVTVIEYSDMPDDLARATRPDGTLRFSAGSIAIHVLNRTFVERITDGGGALPFHRAVKRVPALTPTGATVRPDRPNAVKLEMFVFDAMPLARKVVILETVRREEFAPIKNATGADSPTTCLRDQVARAASWLASAGVAVPRDADNHPAAAIEISPLLALEAADLLDRIDPDMTIKPDDRVYLE